MNLTDTQYGILDFIVENFDLGLTEENCLDDIVSELSIGIGTVRADLFFMKKAGLIEMIPPSKFYTPTPKGMTIVRSD